MEFIKNNKLINIIMSPFLIGLISLVVLINVLFIVFWVYILKYIQRLENNCECSKDVKRDYVKYYAYFAILNVFVGGIVSHHIIKYVFLLISIIGVFIIYSYIKKLKKDKCKCSEEKARTYLEIVNYIQMIMIMFIVLIIVKSAIPYISKKIK